MHHIAVSSRGGRSSQTSHGCSINRAAAASGVGFSVCLRFCFPVLPPASVKQLKTLGLLLVLLLRFLGPGDVRVSLLLFPP